MRCALLALLAAGITTEVAEFHVSPSGNDAAGGSAAAPFRTIQRAADVLQPGDTCVIHAGTYRETVRPPRSGAPGQPIRFITAAKEMVIVTGLDEVTGWTRSTGHVHQAAVDWPVEQVFAAGQLMTPACHPNASTNPFQPNFMELQVTNRQVRGAALDQGSNFWAGGTIWGMDYRLGWVAGSARISASQPGELTLTNKIPWWGNGPGRAILSGVLGALDAEGEWHQQDGRLHFWPPGSADPATLRVEATRRRWAFDLSERAHIEMTGLRLVAASINLDQAAHCVLDGLRVRYASFRRYYVGGFNRDRGINLQAEGVGIALGGTQNTLRNSVVSRCTGDGVSIWGTSNVVENCVIHDCNTSATDCAPVTCTGTGHVLRANTMFNAARSILVHRKLVAGRILHNHLYNAGLLCRDLGMTYTYQTDSQGTEIAYNHIHHNFAKGPGSVGIYLDDTSQGHVVHHNLVHDTGEAMAMNPPDSQRNLVLNNTRSGKLAGIGMGSHRPQNLTGTRIFNNLLTAHISAQVMTSTTVWVTNNLASASFGNFVAPERGDFTLQTNSPAVDAGLLWPPYTDGFTGRAPDLGAFESGQPPWRAGSTLPKEEWD